MICEHKYVYPGGNHVIDELSSDSKSAVCQQMLRPPTGSPRSQDRMLQYNTPTCQDAYSS